MPKLRLLKRYSLNYHLVSGGGKEVVPGHTVTMSSYPATIASIDDFLTVSTGLVTTETTLYLYNDSLYHLLDPASQLLEPVGVMAANRLGRTGEEWTELLARGGPTTTSGWSSTTTSSGRRAPSVPSDGSRPGCDLSLPGTVC